MPARKSETSDGQFEHLMTKKRVADFLGVDTSTVDSLVKYDGLDIAVFTPRSLKSVFYIKGKVIDWEKKMVGGWD